MTAVRITVNEYQPPASLNTTSLASAFAFWVYTKCLVYASEFSIPDTVHMMCALTGTGYMCHHRQGALPESAYNYSLHTIIPLCGTKTIQPVHIYLKQS